MSEWKLAMVLVLPFMNCRVKLRAWIALMGASVAALAFPPLAVKAYLVIDTIAGGVVLHKHKDEQRHAAQKGIGLLFAMMVIFHGAYILSGGVVGSDLYFDANKWMGWLQLLCLIGWWVHDTGVAALRVFGSVRREVASGDGVRA